MAATEHLRSLVPVLWATCSPKSPVYLPGAAGLDEATFTSSEGAQQGDSLASAAFCVAVHPEIKQLDAELAAGGGAARFDMDDGYAMGPAGVVFSAIERFAERVAAIGLELQLDKRECYCPHGGLEASPHRPPQMPLGTAAAADGSVGYGIPVGGYSGGRCDVCRCIHGG